ncbi:unnamed protein product, partial [Vitis vinifera]|uniref:Uncharacterized protein n=1 Tax=Vitis vinifera TaxID=29760 RepID=D7TYS0_VITVI
MPHRTQPMIGLLVFTGINVVLASTIALVYDFVCFLPYWERRRERRHQEREAFLCTLNQHKRVSREWGWRKNLSKWADPDERPKKRVKMVWALVGRTQMKGPGLGFSRQ